MRRGLGALTGEVVAGAKIDLRVSRNTIAAVAYARYSIGPSYPAARREVGAVHLHRATRYARGDHDLHTAGEQIVERNWPSRDVFHVATSSVIRDFRQQGLGLALYRTAIEAAWDHHRAVVVSHSCVADGDTSDEALRVWRALGRYYDVVALGDCKAVLGARRDR